MTLFTDLLFKAARLLGSPYKKMDEGCLKAFVTSFLEHRDVFTGLVREHGSPLYVLDEGRLRSRARRFKQVFEEHLGPVDVFFAMKSNNMPEISRIMVEEGVGLDVSSGVELAQACEVGATRIFFSGPGKTGEELIAAIDQAERVTVLIDSFGELRRLDHLTRWHRRTVRAGVRLTTNPNGLWRKFGIPLSSLSQFICEAHAAPFVKLEGLQFHTGWNLSPDEQTSFIARLGSVLRDLPADLLNSIKFLDIGGGFWPEQGEWLRAAGTHFGKFINLLFPRRPDTISQFWLQSCPIDVFADEIAKTIQAALPKNMNCRICLEPGRWLCHEASHLLMTVLDVKDNNMVITDAGTNAIGWERFEHDYFPVINLSNPGIEEHPCNILGPLCSLHDVWGYSYHGSAICAGNLLLIPTQGAYTYSLRQNFIKPLPKVIRLPVEVVPNWPISKWNNHKIE